MMFSRMNKYSQLSWRTYIFLILLFVVPFGHAEANKADSPPNAQIFNSYDDYLAEDKLLNDLYKVLLKSLNKNNAGLLKQAQRKWIKWRDQTCISAQANVNLKLGALGSSVRDDCLISLTEQRATEIQHFINEPKGASRSKYNFSCANDYSEPDNSSKN